MNTRTRFDARMDKRDAVNNAEKAGLVADNMTVRMALMTRVENGEITLLEAQLELKKLKASAKKAGLLTRAKVFSQS